MKYLTAIFMLFVAHVYGQDLREYQEQAVEQNPALKAKTMEFEAAMERIIQVKGLPDPTFSFSALGQMIETRVGPQRARFTLSQMFPWFGALKAQGNAAALEAEAMFQQLVEEQNEIRFDVARSYYAMAEIEEVVSIQRANLSVLGTWKRLALTKYESGQTPLSEVLQIDLMISEQETELEITMGKLDPLRVSFNRLLNRPDSIRPVLVMPEVPEIDLLINPEWDKHPQLTEMNRRIEMGRHRQESIKKGSLPMIGIGLDYVIVAERTDVNVPDNGKDAIMPMVSLSLPIYRKKYRAAMKENELRVKGYEQTFEAKQNDLITAYESIKYEIERELDLIGLYNRQIDETERIRELMLTGFSTTGDDLDGLLRIQMQLLNYQLKLVRSTSQVNILAENLKYNTATYDN